MQTQQLKVTKLSCDGCASKVRHALHAIGGVIDVKLSGSTGNVEVRYDEHRVSTDQMVSAVKAAGYGVGAGLAFRVRGCRCGQRAPGWLS